MPQPPLPRCDCTSKAAGLAAPLQNTLQSYASVCPPRSMHNNALRAILITCDFTTAAQQVRKHVLPAACLMGCPAARLPSARAPKKETSSTLPCRKRGFAPTPASLLRALARSMPRLSTPAPASACPQQVRMKPASELVMRMTIGLWQSPA